MSDGDTYDAGGRNSGGGGGNNTYKYTNRYYNNSNSNSNSNDGSYNRNRGVGGPRRNENDDTRSNNYSYGPSGRDNDKVVYVLTAVRGAIIGSQGSVVRDIEQKSSAKIYLNRNKQRGNEPRETEVRISGSTAAKEQAWEMIKNIVSADNCREAATPPSNSNSNYNSNSNNEYVATQRRSDKYHKDDNEPPSSSRNDNDNFNRTNRSGGGGGGGGGGGNDFFDSGKTADKVNKYRRTDDSYSNNNNNYSSSRTRYDNSSKTQNTPLANTMQGSSQNEYQEIDYDALYRAADENKAAALASLAPIVKNLYHEDDEIKSMTCEEVADFRMKNMNISVSRVFAENNDEKLPIPNPVKTFEQAFRPYPDILATIKRQNFEKPSPIQAQSWPILLSGQDLIGIAQTGTGKTLAFLLPAMLHIDHQTEPRDKRRGPTVLVLSPTRELALQIEKEINKYSYKNIKCVCVYGGGIRKEQITALHKNKPEIVVATPGRLDDFLMACEIQLDSVTYVVLDEADKMLEMGFECQIRKILINVRSDRQSVMTSATWPSGVRRLASQYSKNPVQVVVGSLDLAAVHTVSQTIEIIDEDDKRERLMEFLREMEPDDKAIVFCGKKSVTDDIASNLILKDIKCQSLHGDREQCDREQALQDLKTGEVHILIATDVAARGIDIVDITHIFNYDFPKNIEEYVHRIGRTGRAGRTGHSISLFTRKDWANAADLIKILTEANQGVPDELIKMSERFEVAQSKRDSFPRSGGGGRYQRGNAPRGGRNFANDRSGGGGGGGGRFRSNNY